MRTASVVLALIVPTAMVAQEAQEAQATGLAVAEAAVATGVMDRQPQGAAETFAPTVGELYCWTKITGAADSTRIEHVWYHGDEEAARIAVTVNGPTWRTWTRKTIPAEWTGAWRVDVVGPDGTVLESVSFTVQ